MSKNNLTDPRMHFVPRFLPAVLGLVMLVVYALTLNPWVNLLNVSHVARISGWVWQPQLYGPLLYLVTLPFRWLPAASIPLALNLFSALCGALTLLLLARSVILLPHDRTDAERQRERSDFVFLTGWPAWFPPVVAVLFAGLQLTFWENATNFTGESFDLLLFAVVIWQLLEYRLDEQEWRLLALAFFYGAGITENWAFITFSPVFLAALIWLRKLDFFNLRFLGRMAVRGLLGLGFILLLPLIIKISGHYQATFWDTLKPALQADWSVVRAIKSPTVRHSLALMSLTTLLPILVISLRWSATFGDNSHIGAGLANNLIHFVFAVIFGAGVWIMFDSPFSPRQLGLGTNALTLYYFAALAIGYFCGYFLLVFGKNPLPTRRTSRPLPILPKNIMWLCPVIVVGVLVTAAFMLGCLLYKNTPVVREINSPALLKYAAAATRSLPRSGGVLLCDTESQGQPIRAFLIQSMLAREGRSRDFLIADTSLLSWGAYQEFLHKQSPNRWPAPSAAMSTNFLNPPMVVNILDSVSKSNAIYYLNPSFGYFFEHFYQEPHGLVYAVKTLSNTTLVPPPWTKELVAENEAIWSEIPKQSLSAVEKALQTQAEITTPPLRKANNPASWVLSHLHAPPEPNQNGLYAGMIYSRSLDNWSVELQRAGKLESASAGFALAEKFNPDNVAAAINGDFNRALRAGTNSDINPALISSDRFGRYHNWNELLNACGPFDETSFCFQHGIYCLQNSFYNQPMPLTRQALASFLRVRQLVPDNLPARLWLAQIYLFNRVPAPALEALQDPLQHPQRFALNETNDTEIHLLAAAAHFQNDDLPHGIQMLETEVARHPENDSVLTTASQAFFQNGLYTNALRVVERKLKRSPNDPDWLFGKGVASLHIGAYDQAITALTRVLEIRTNEPTARFNRALAYLQSDKLNLARADYSALATTFTNSYQVHYGLGEVAWRTHDTNEAIRNYQRFLTIAPTNTAELKLVRERLTQLGGK